MPDHTTKERKIEEIDLGPAIEYDQPKIQDKINELVKSNNELRQMITHFIQGI